MGASMVIDFMTPIQLDALMGSVSAIQDMIMQYNKGNVFILPARPDRFEKINARGLKIPEGKISISYVDGVDVTISAERDCDLTLYYNSQKKALSLKSGETEKIKF